MVVVIGAGLLAPVAGGSATGHATASDPHPIEQADVSAEIIDLPVGFLAQAGVVAPSAGLGDPLGLVPKADFQRRYSLDTDTIEVWRCGPVVSSHSVIISHVNSTVVPYFAAISGGVYTPSFVAGGDVPGPASSCVDQVAAASTSAPEGVLIIDDWTAGGYASPGFVCSVGDCSWIASTYPGNGRYTIVGEGALFSAPFVTSHELGHALHWPHSNAGQGNQYDNPVDVMSGNTSSSDPYFTLAYNRYVSGWISPAEVTVFAGSAVEVQLQPQHLAGTQMIVIPTATEGLFYTFGTRVQTTSDPLPLAWEGVEVYLIDQVTCPGWSGATPCPSIWRTHTQEPPAPFGTTHVLDVGDSVVVGGVPVSVTARSGDTFTVTVGLGSGSFLDVAGSVFEADITWLADQGITKGCNPPANTLFCPDDTVTRAQMAAFMVRALGYTDDGGGNLFVDDDGSVFESDIDKLAFAGVTSGCNPPTNDQFCPGKLVTRGQMAAFLHRALG